jgi:uncharacterized protein (DUF58 family)
MSRRGLAITLIALALLLGALATRNGTLALVALPFLAYLATGLWEAPRAGLRIAAERALDSTRTEDTTAVRVTVRVRSEGAAVAALWLSDALPDGVAMSEGSSEKCGGLGPGEATQLEYVFQASRGVFRWKSLHAVASDPFRLFEKELDLPAGGEIVVRPRVRRFRPFTLRPERTIRSPGSILGGRAGSGTDFWGVREYQPGDQMRRLDWRRAARNPGRLFTREHEQEEIADIGLILDARAQTNPRPGDSRLVESAIDATASLAEMFLRGGNRVGLVLLENTLRAVFPGYGKVKLNQVLRALAEVPLHAESSHFSLEQVPLRVFSTRAVIVIVSALTGGEWQIFSRLRARGNEGLVVSPDPACFVQDAAQDEAGRLARRAARIERRLDLRRVAQLGIRVVDWKAGSSLAPLVRRALQPVRGHAP